MAEHIVSLTLDPIFSRLLNRQDGIQSFLLANMVSELDDRQLAEFIRNQALALTAEVHEVLEETHWKPWAVKPDNEPVVVDKTRYTNEMADVFIFFMNLMLAGGVSMTDLAKAVDSKQSKNLSRWVNGYDGKTNKCQACRRAYDDDGVKCTPPQGEALAFCADRERFIDKNGQTV